MNEKLEDLLRFALETPEEVRQQTEDLNTGFDEDARTWELIVKYHGSLEKLEETGVQVEYLIAGYAILTVPEALVEAVAALEEIEYVEKPKRYFYSQIRPRESSCILELGPAFTGQVFTGPTSTGSTSTGQVGADQFGNAGTVGLSGKGVLIAVLDSGIEYRLPEFRRSDGTTRIKYLWDQTIVTADGPDGNAQESAMGEQTTQKGVVYTEEQINVLLAEEDSTSDMSPNGTENVAQNLTRPSSDTSGHGTAVAAIAAGNSDTYQGVAPAADLIVVKLGVPGVFSFPRTTEIMRAVSFAVQKGVELQQPLVINLSFGNTYGAHDGSSLLERFLDNAAEIGRTVICVGTGNEGSNGGHAAGRVGEDSFGVEVGGSVGNTTFVELAVADYETSLNVQLWKNYQDDFDVYLRAPSGEEVQVTHSVEGGKYTIDVQNTRVLIYIGEPTPYSVAQEIYLELLPLDGSFINSGIWTFRLEEKDVTDVSGGFYYFYLPSGAVRNEGTGFLRPNPEVTLTIPSTAAKVITVGAYDPVFESYADFSGRGYADANRTIGVVMAGLTKPDLVAPGVDILAPNTFGGLSEMTGTSFATPIVSGSAALLMEWGIVRGNDPFLYGEKIKAYLRKGARPLRGEAIYPNERVGWGALCVADSFPGI